MCNKFNTQVFVTGLRKKNLVNKNQGWKPIHQKYKTYENRSRHKQRCEQKPTITKNQVKALCKEDS